jgi:bifunctional non-homologous end joining protein LigD
MPDKLAKYRGMRDFAGTPEPAGDAAAAPPGGRFVIQEHHARRLHWDLRLEHEGALASWAVPNGIPPDPDENRKAVRTEDHPLEYLEFHGEIPKGNYGAGTMSIWDTGTYECHSWSDRKVVVTLHGERVRGRYALFRAGGETDWMIHRMDPPDAGREPMPERIVPMKASLGTLPGDDERWAYEIKWDGVRAIAYVRPGRLHVESRNLNDITAQYPELRGLVNALGAREAVLDGEIVAFDADGRPSFERLQQRMHQTSESVIRRRTASHPVTFVVFDLLYLDGRVLTELPYAERRELLEGLDLRGPHWNVPSYTAGGGAGLLAATREQGLEGLVGKRLDSRYEPGRRARTWVKVKNTARQEVVIGGWLLGEGRRRDRVGALLVGYQDGGRLRYAGKVGTGWGEKEGDRLLALLRERERDGSPFEGRQPPRGAVFVEPDLVCEVEFTEWTRDGMLRHPSYKGTRDDKPAAEVVRERVEERPPEPAAEAPFELPAKRPAKGHVEATVEGRKLRLSNLGKVLYPKAGFTKGDVIDYYARVAPALLPHLRSRPLTLKRYPNGVEGEHFYEKRCPDHRPPWVRTAAIWSDRNEGIVDYCVCDDLPTLVWAANLADLELHPSLSLCDDIERPTAVAFDLDPGPGTDVVDCCRVALWLRGLFEQLGLQAFPKTSGSKGMQIYLPLNHDVGYERTKAFAHQVAMTLEQQFPDQVTSKMAKAERPGRVFIDWSQNDSYKTTVCVYSLRARERPTVSTPLEWGEVERCLAAQDASLVVFEAHEVLERVERHGDLFAPVVSLVQRLPV